MVAACGPCHLAASLFGHFVSPRPPRPIMWVHLCAFFFCNCLCSAVARVRSSTPRMSAASLTPTGCAALEVRCPTPVAYVVAPPMQPCPRMVRALEGPPRRRALSMYGERGASSPPPLSPYCPPGVSPVPQASAACLTRVPTDCAAPLGVRAPIRVAFATATTQSAVRWVSGTLGARWWILRSQRPPPR
jgi:hypothetical protein